MNITRDPDMIDGMRQAAEHGWAAGNFCTPEHCMGLYVTLGTDDLHDHLGSTDLPQTPCYEPLVPWDGVAVSEDKATPRSLKHECGLTSSSTGLVEPKPSYPGQNSLYGLQSKLGHALGTPLLPRSTDVKMRRRHLEAKVALKRRRQENPQEVYRSARRIRYSRHGDQDNLAPIVDNKSVESRCMQTQHEDADSENSDASPTAHVARRGHVPRMACSQAPTRRPIIAAEEWTASRIDNSRSVS